MNQIVTDANFLGHLPKQLLISDMFTEFSREDSANCPFASAYEQVKGVPFFKGKSTPITFVYNDGETFSLASDTLQTVSDLTGYQIINKAESEEPKSILHVKADCGDHDDLYQALLALTKSERSLLEIVNFKNIDYVAYIALKTLIEQNLINGKLVDGVMVVLQEHRSDKAVENEFAQKLRALTITINQQ